MDKTTYSKYLLLNLLFTFYISPNTYQSTEILKKFSIYLEKGTYDHQDWSSFKVKPKSRYHTFSMAFEHFEKTNGKIIVELGTSRSFVDGAYPGCNSDDTKYWEMNNPGIWDWGAGCFTLMASQCLSHLNPTIHTVDIMTCHINRCKLMTQEFKHILNYHVMSSVDFLKQFNPPQGIDLLYIDTGDMTPIEPTAQLQLEEIQIIIERDLLSPDGLIVIDDVKNQTPVKFGDKSGMGKSKYALPYLIEHGYEIIADEYQVILKKVSR